MLNTPVSRFDLEEKIMDCWSVTRDIDALYRHVCNSKDISEDEIANILLGLKQLYDIRFNELFDTFERLIHVG